MMYVCVGDVGESTVMGVDDGAMTMRCDDCESTMMMMGYRDWCGRRSGDVR